MSLNHSTHLKKYHWTNHILGLELGDGIAKAVLRTLADFARCIDGQWQCWPSYNTLADTSEFSRSTIIRKIQFLADKGIITITHRITEDESESNLYTIRTDWIANEDTAELTLAHQKSQEVVAERHHPSITQTPPQYQSDTTLVSESNHPSVRVTPESFKEPFTESFSESFIESSSRAGAPAHTREEAPSDVI